MSEIGRSFENFLGHEKTSKKIDNIISTLLIKSNRLYSVNEADINDLRQNVLMCLLEKKDLWPKILAMPSPWLYIRQIIKNAIMDSLTSSQTENPLPYFRKRVVDTLRDAQNTETSTHLNNKKRKKQICYSFKKSIDPHTLHIASEQLGEVPFQNSFTDAGTDAVRTQKRIIEMAEYFLDFWEKREGMECRIAVDSFVEWVKINVNIKEVFGHDDLACDELLIKNNTEDEEPRDAGNRDVENIGYRKDHDDPSVRSDFRNIAFKAAQSLDKREKICFLLYLEEMTYEKIAPEIGLNGPSGVKAVLNRIRAKIMGILEESGFDRYSGEDSSGILINRAFYVYLKEALKSSD